MLAQSLSTLKKRGKELGNQLSKELSNTILESRKGSSLESDFAEFVLDDAADSGTVLVRYLVQNDEDGDREFAAFSLPSPAGGYCTLATLRAHFCLPGSYHFRFRMPSPEGAFSGFMWADIGDGEPLPVSRGVLTMKALKFPDEAVAAPRPGAAPGPQQGAAVAPGGAGGLLEMDLNMQAAPAPAPGQRSGGVPDDLMQMDMGGGAAAAPGASAAPRITKPLASREDLVAAREEETRRRVAEAAAASRAQAEAESSLRAGKVDAGNKIKVEMDKWAKTSDGQSFKDIRTLLSTMHEVMWPDSGWKELPLSELIAPGTIKKYYRKAIVLTHPDRFQSAEPEKQLRAERVFQALNEAFKKGGGN